MDNVLRFYLLSTTLKEKIRTGANLWNVHSSRRESIAEHIYGTCILAIAMDSEYKLDINLEKVIKMLVIHELEEVIIGDITPFDKVSKEELEEQARNAVIKVLGDLAKKEEYLALTDEFNEKKTKDAKFAFMVDKMEFILQMIKLTNQGKIVLGDNTSELILNSDKIKMLLENGATNAEDIFYLYDRDKFKDSAEFSELLDCAYRENLSDLLKKFLN